MRELIPKEAASDLLQPYLPIMNQVMVASLNTLNNGLNAMDVSVNNRSKATTFHSIAVEKTKKAFEEQSKISLLPKYQSIQIIFNGQMVGRIKKLNKKNFTSNASSSRNDMIVGQQLKLFKLPEITYIDLGYTIDPTWTSFEKLIVICRLNDEIKWELPFDDNSLEITLKTEPITIAPIQTETQIKLKNAKGKL